MAVATGAALCSMAKVAQHLCFKTKLNPQGWSLNFAVLGMILFLTGLHMTVTWPLAKYYPFDNIVFGEPSLVLGTLLLGIAFYMWKNRESIKTAQSPMMSVAQDLRHFKYILYGMGLALIGVAIAGVRYKLFAAPPEEPIAGEFAEYPIVEALFISGLWAFTGIAAILCPFVFERFANGKRGQTPLVKVTYKLIYTLGVIFLLFGAMNYFTHIGLIVNTMPNQ
ncbi:DUF981 family protein [Winogradskyella maritima]|nr:DUF981 family protein [Winogradskyella maritima]